MNEAIMKTIDNEVIHEQLFKNKPLLVYDEKTLTGNYISNNQFNDFDEPVSEFERKTVIQIANTVV